MTMTAPTLHLAPEAVVAMVDGELSRGARARAEAHLDSCPQCRMDVAAQREAKSVLSAAGGPMLPDGLLARLRDIPFTTDLDTPGLTLVMQGESLQWTQQPQPEPRSPTQPTQAPPDRRPEGRAPALSAPANRRPGLSPVRLRRLRRGLIGAVASLTVGVLAASVGPVSATAGTGAAGAGPRTSQQRTQDVGQLPDVSTTLVRRLRDTPPQFAGFLPGNR